MTTHTAVQATSLERDHEPKAPGQRAKRLNWFDKLCALMSFSFGTLLMAVCVLAPFMGGDPDGLHVTPIWLCIPLFLMGWGMTVTFLKVWRHRPRGVR